MAESNEFPRLVYRDGGEEEVWGRKCALLEVHDADGLAAALGEGWTLRPDGLNEEPAEAASAFSLLDEKVAVIVEHLPALTKDELSALLEAEQAGKTRKSVIEAIEAALADA